MAAASLPILALAHIQAAARRPHGNQRGPVVATTWTSRTDGGDLGLHLLRLFACAGLLGGADRAPTDWPEPAADRGAGGQWLPVSSPLSFWWIWALGWFRPMISTSLPRWAYLVSIASRAATEEASQM